MIVPDGSIEPLCEVCGSGLKMKLVSERKVKLDSSPVTKDSGSVQTFRCRNCGTTMAKTVPPKPKGDDGQLG